MIKRGQIKVIHGKHRTYIQETVGEVTKQYSTDEWAEEQVKREEAEAKKAEKEAKATKSTKKVSEPAKADKEKPAKAKK